MPVSTASRKMLKDIGIDLKVEERPSSDFSEIATKIKGELVDVVKCAHVQHRHALQHVGPRVFTGGHCENLRCHWAR